MKEISLQTHSRVEMIDITAAVQKAAGEGKSELIIIENGCLVLGTWQSVFFCEFDGPRTRKVIIKIVKSISDEVFI